MTLNLTLGKVTVCLESDDKVATTITLSGGKENKTASFNYVPTDMFDIIDGIKSCLKQGAAEEFFMGQRVRDEEHGVGTVICLCVDGYYGVMFDNWDGRLHNCDYNDLVWGMKGTDMNCWWLYPKEIIPIEKCDSKTTETFFDKFGRYIELTRKESD